MGGDLYTEMYSYHPAGAKTAKKLRLYRPGQTDPNGVQVGNVDLNLSYTYDNAGRTSSMTYPFTPNPSYTPYTDTFNYGYDSMGRPNSLTDTGVPALGINPITWVSSISYDNASRITSLGYYNGITQTRSYNVNGQLASLNWSNYYPSSGGIAYTYSATQNNGQITQVTDSFSGETISYQYDALKRLISAASTPTSGSSTAPWTETFQYDGFGNLTGKTLNGASNPLPVNAATNQLSSAFYDANGNMGSGAGGSMIYDELNRLTFPNQYSGADEAYGYAPDNKRVYRKTSTGTEEWTLYGVRGEKLGVYQLLMQSNGIGGYTWSFSPKSSNVWFAGSLILSESQPAYIDRLGTNRATGTNSPVLSNGARFYPYGDEITSTSNDRLKFATYTRDSYTGLDYADQRFYASIYGRFNSPDPYQASGGPSDPGSWNRYAYVQGDPVNANDPKGLYQSIAGDDGDWCIEDPFDPACGDSSADLCGQFAGCYDPTEGASGSWPPCSPVISAFKNSPCPIVPLTPVQGPTRPPGGLSGAAPPPPIYCEPDVIAAMATAWSQSANGTSGAEAGFNIKGPPVPGMYQIVPNPYTNQYRRQTIKIPPGTTSNFHVHPNGTSPAASPTDQAIANNFNIDIFTFSSSGLYEYIPGAKSAISLRSGLSWLTPCN